MAIKLAVQIPQIQSEIRFGPARPSGPRPQQVGRSKGAGPTLARAEQDHIQPADTTRHAALHLRQRSHDDRVQLQGASILEQTDAERQLMNFLTFAGVSGRALEPVVFARMYQRLRRAVVQEIRPLQVYLAGPNVFFDPADRIFERQKEILADVGLRGISPEDLQADLRDKATPHEVALAIGEADYQAMAICELAIANLHPWPVHPDPAVKAPVEPDAGTSVEIGAMEQQGKVIYGYLGLGRDRTVFERYKTYLDHGVHQDAKGLWRDRNEVMFDATDGPGNLMLGTAIERSGGVVAWHDAPPERAYLDLTAFREVARIAADAHVAKRWRPRTKRPGRA